MAAGLAVGACSTGSDPGSAVPTTLQPATTTTGAPAGEPAAPVVDWEAVSTVALGGGWALDDAEGDGPFYDVRRDGDVVGQLEAGSFPVETLDVVAEVLDGGGSAVDALEAHAREYAGTFGDDRASGCGADYRFVANPAMVLDTPSGDVVAYGFTGTLADGAPSERIVQFAGLRDDRLVILTATAADPGGCLPPEGPTFTSEQLESFRPLLVDVVAASGLPPVTAG